jgi:hypothetical protein
MNMLALLIVALVVLLLWIINRRYEDRYDVVGLWIGEAGVALVLIPSNPTKDFYPERRTRAMDLSCYSMTMVAPRSIATRFSLLGQWRSS